MVMGMREELIELLKEAMVLSDGICRIVGNTQAKAIGHYLFAHGVTIPVRCKDCKHWLHDFPGCTDAIGRCEWANYMVGCNGYCVYGERRTDD